MGSKLPKRILRMKGLTMKQKWALHKRGVRTTTKKGGTVNKKGSVKKWVKKQWGLGRIIGAARMVDVIARPAQWAYHYASNKKDGILYAYSAGMAGVPDGKYQKDIAKSVYGEMGTGLATTYLKSKTGVYRGAGKGKLLSIAQALSPEILALSEGADPTKDLKHFNNVRRGYDSGSNGTLRGWDLDPSTPQGKRFWMDKSFNILLGVVQKTVFNTNGLLKLNKLLPKGLNG